MEILTFSTFSKNSDLFPFSEELRKKLRYSFDTENYSLSIHGAFRPIPALLDNFWTPRKNNLFFVLNVHIRLSKTVNFVDPLYRSLTHARTK